MCPISLVFFAWPLVFNTTWDELRGTTIWKQFISVTSPPQERIIKLQVFLDNFFWALPFKGVNCIVLSPKTSAIFFGCQMSLVTGRFIPESFGLAFLLNTCDASGISGAYAHWFGDSKTLLWLGDFFLTSQIQNCGPNNEGVDLISFVYFC